MYCVLSLSRISLSFHRVFFLVGGLWIVVSFAVRIMAAVTVNLFEDTTVIDWTPNF